MLIDKININYFTKNYITTSQNDILYDLKFKYSFNYTVSYELLFCNIFL